MLALSICAAVLSIIAGLLTIATARALSKLEIAFRRQAEAQRQWKISTCEAIEVCLALPPQTVSASAPLAVGDTPAFARNLSDGPSGHIFHGHPEHIRPLNPVLS